MTRRGRGRGKGERPYLQKRRCYPHYDARNVGKLDRRESRHACDLCEDNLCVDPCFLTFHMNLGFGEGYHEEGNGDDTVEDGTDTAQYSMV